jgi:hypothetical protein
VGVRAMNGVTVVLRGAFRTDAGVGAARVRGTEREELSTARASTAPISARISTVLTICHPVSPNRRLRNTNGLPHQSHSSAVGRLRPPQPGQTSELLGAEVGDLSLVTVQGARQFEEWEGLGVWVRQERATGGQSCTSRRVAQAPPLC